MALGLLKHLSSEKSYFNSLFVYLYFLEIIQVWLSGIQSLFLRHERLHLGRGSLLHHLDGVAGDVGLGHDVVLDGRRRAQLLVVVELIIL